MKISLTDKGLRSSVVTDLSVVVSFLLRNNFSRIFLLLGFSRLIQLRVGWFRLYIFSPQSKKNIFFAFRFKRIWASHPRCAGFAYIFFRFKAKKISYFSLSFALSECERRNLIQLRETLTYWSQWSSGTVEYSPGHNYSLPSSPAFFVFSPAL